VASIYQIAEKTGVSPKTVARILSGNTTRSKYTSKVIETARKLGYVRNQQAANLRSGISNLIGVVVPDLRNPFYPKFVQTIHDTCLQSGYQIFLSSTFGDPNEELRALQLFQNYRVDGVIFNSSESRSTPECEALLNALIESGRPIVMAGREAGDLPMDQVVLRNISATEKLVSYLVKVGHKRIAYLGGPKTYIAFRERLEGYFSSMKKAGLAVHQDWVSSSEPTHEDAYARTGELLKLPESCRPTAIVGGNDVMAIGALKCLLENGVRVPEEMAVAGFDDIPMARLVHPGLTTLRQPQERIAEECVKLLINRIRERDRSEPRTLTYEPDLIIREST